jgi:23S rRNA (uracil1939-C5)-methyltransferase
VDAFDSGPGAIAALSRAHAHTPGLKPLRATVRDLFRSPVTARELAAFDAALFDPPRQGAEAQARQIAASGLSRVVAVSCDPGTFARDAQTLVSAGFTLDRLVAVDQFRWTAHVEIAALFSRPRKRGGRGA